MVYPPAAVCPPEVTGNSEQPFDANRLPAGDAATLADTLHCGLTPWWAVSFVKRLALITKLVLSIAKDHHCAHKGSCKNNGNRHQSPLVAPTERSPL